MPTPTYTPLANITLGSAQASVSFTSISGLYRDLVFVATGTSSVGAAIEVRLNSDSTSSNYNRVIMFGTGSSAISASGNDNLLLSFTTAQSQNTLQIMDYSATDKHKTMLVRTDVDSLTRAAAARWSNTAAVTGVSFVNTGGNFVAGSTFALYGIAA